MSLKFKIIVVFLHVLSGFIILRNFDKCMGVFKGNGKVAPLSGSPSYPGSQLSIVLCISMFMNVAYTECRFLFA